MPPLRGMSTGTHWETAPQQALHHLLFNVHSTPVAPKTQQEQAAADVQLSRTLLPLSTSDPALMLMASLVVQLRLTLSTGSFQQMSFFRGETLLVWAGGWDWIGWPGPIPPPLRPHRCPLGVDDQSAVVRSGPCG